LWIMSWLVDFRLEGASIAKRKGRYSLEDDTLGAITPLGGVSAHLDVDNHRLTHH
jgi:hypothetical protein